MELQGRTEQTEMPLLVTAAVVFDGEKVLLTRRPDDKRHPGFWEFPGGKVDPGESPEQALCREMLEELDVEVRVSGIYEVVFYRYEWGTVLILAYQCELLSDTLRDLGVAEHRWVLPREMVNFNILPADQPIIDRLNT
jgi:8-oxo-dGTP diphosphatase